MGYSPMNKPAPIAQRLKDEVVLPLWPDVGQALCMSRNSVYAAAVRGEIETIRIGRLKRVPTAWLRRKLGLDGATA
jgi:hypothetical protein